jgi:large subunit ribosomal protein L5
VSASPKQSPEDKPAPEGKQASAGAPASTRRTPRLLERYRKEIRPKLRSRLKVENDLALPRIQKITLSMGVGGAVENKKLVDAAAASLTNISGQKAVVTEARVSVASWKVREGMPIGAKVTLRGSRCYEFLDRLISVVIPRIRDFRGMPTRFDGRGNYSLGIAEQTVFPEIDIDKTEGLAGLNVTITIAGGSDARSRALLEEFGFPFAHPEAAARG